MAVSPNDVRFALLSENHAKYSLVFKELGYVPNEEESYMLGGLEYFEEILEELLKPENVDRLIAEMKTQGIYVS